MCVVSAIRTYTSEALPVLPSSEEYSMLSDNSRGKLPKPLQFVAPQRFCDIIISSSPVLH